MIRFLALLPLLALLVLPAAAQAADGKPTAAAPGAAAKEGPMLTDQELFEALDMNTAGLAAAKTAAAAGDYAAARKALAVYLRARTNVPWGFDPHRIDRNTAYNRQGAANALAGKVQVVTIWHNFADGQIDWLFNATTARADLPDNNEWLWQLNRMGFWYDLGRAYWATGDEQYARAWAEQLRRWVRQCPLRTANYNAAGSPWRTIECGIRMSGSWPDAYHRFLLSPSVTEDDLALYLKASIEHARQLRQHFTTGNWLTMEMNGLFTVGALFPELKEAQEWRAFAAQKLYDEVKTQFLPDGAQVELTPGYHQVALDNILGLASLAGRLNRAADLPADYVAGAERAFDYNEALMTPDRSLPRFNDSWPVNVPRTLERAGALFPKRQDFAWIAGNGKNGAAPTETSRALPYAGYFVMRSGWDREANYFVLDAGPLGYGHYHQDKLNVVLWGYGRELLFDGGGGSYESSKWRSYGTDTFSHNTVLVDGLPQRRATRDQAARVSRTPIAARWESTGTHDFAAGVYQEGYGKDDNRPATHVRRVLFLKPDLFLVADTLTPNDGAAHTYEARWHLLPTATAKDEVTGVVTTTDAGRPNLAVVPLSAEGMEIRIASAQTDPVLLGWHVRKDMDPQYVPATTVLHTRQGTGVQQFLTLFVPLQTGAVNPVKQVRVTAPDAREVLLADGRRLQITVDPNPAGNIRVAETLADGKPGRQVTAGKAER